MNHQYIEDEFIIERFIECDLDENDRRAFFEHCLECEDCRQSLYIARKIDKAIVRTRISRRKPSDEKSQNQKKVLLYSTFAAFIIIAFVIGTLVNKGSNNNIPQVAEKPKNESEKPIIPVIDKKDTVKPNTLNTIEKSQPKKQIKEEIAPISTPDSYDEQSTEFLAYTEVNYDMKDVSNLLSIDIDGGTATKGSGNSDIGIEMIIEKLNEISGYGSSAPAPEIKIPLPNATIKYGITFEASWTSENQHALFTIIFVNLNGEVSRSFKDIQEKKIRIKKGLPIGEYFMIVLEQGSQNWHVVKFSVKSQF